MDQPCYRQLVACIRTSSVGIMAHFHEINFVAFASTVHCSLGIRAHALYSYNFFFFFLSLRSFAFIGNGGRRDFITLPWLNDTDL